jgi:MFS superfamily sulfate permease-like transporter
VFVGVLVDVFVGVLVDVFVGVLVGVFVGVLVGVFVGVLVSIGTSAAISGKYTNSASSACTRCGSCLGGDEAIQRNTSKKDESVPTSNQSRCLWDSLRDGLENILKFLSVLNVACYTGTNQNDKAVYSPSAQLHAPCEDILLFYQCSMVNSS